MPVADYRIGARTEAIVDANWKILVENYNECLHCAVVHPELVDVIPIYRTGHVVDPDRDDEIVDLKPGASALTLDGRTSLSPLPGISTAAEYSGLAFFPNVEFDLTPTTLALTSLFPIAPDRTLVVAEYLFAADDVARPGFDPSPEVDMNELVGRQDFAVCEMVQRGVSSPSFAGGGLTRKDAYVTEFVGTVPRQQRADRDKMTTDAARPGHREMGETMRTTRRHFIGQATRPRRGARCRASAAASVRGGR